MTELVCHLDKNGKINTGMAKSIYDEAINYSSDITLIINDKEVNAKKLLQMLNLGENWGDKAVIRAEGIDEKLAGNYLMRLFMDLNRNCSFRSH